MPGIIRILRQQENVDKVLLLSHLGFPQDLELLKDVDGVDIALGVHTHHCIFDAFQQNSTLVIQSGSRVSHPTRLDLLVENDEIIKYEHRLIEVLAKIKPDPLGR